MDYSDFELCRKLKKLIHKTIELKITEQLKDNLKESEEYVTVLTHLKKIEMPHLSRLTTGTIDPLLERMIWRFYSEYLKYNSSFNDVEFSKFYLDFENLIYDKLQREYYALTDWGIETTLDIDGMKLRKTTSNEISILFSPDVFHHRFGDDDFYIIEILKNYPYQPHEDYENLITSLNLFTGMFGRQYINTWKIPRFWPIDSGRWGTPLTRRSVLNYSKPLLKNSEIDEFTEFYYFYKNSSKAKQLKTAINRYNLGMQSNTFDDEILDFMIAIESLFGENKPELTHRISIRVALLLGKNEFDTECIRKFITEIYGIRSKIAHGDEISIKNFTLNGMKLKIQIILNESIKAFLNMMSSGKSIKEIHKELDNSISSPRLRNIVQKQAKVIL